MKTSAQFEQTLFYRPNPATDQLFEDKSDTLFQHPGESSCLEIHEQEGNVENSPITQDLFNKRQKADLDGDDVSEPPSPVDYIRHEGDNPPPPPPHYNEAPGMRKHHVSTVEELDRVASVSLAVGLTEQ